MVFSVDNLDLLLAEVNNDENITSENLDRLEELVSRANELNLSPTEQLIPDAIYDHVRGILAKHRPDSLVLQTLWDDHYGVSEPDDRDKYLHESPMLSIQTQKSWNDAGLVKFCNTLVNFGSPVLFASYKVNGHGIRVVYEDGVLVKARSRARASEGRDLTRQMVNILGEENINLRGLGLVEIRGEVALPVDRLEKAREFNSGLKSAFTAVSSLIKPASSVEENRLLEFYAYWVRYDGVENELTSKLDEYEWLERVGFTVPGYFTIDDTYSTPNEALGVIKSVFTSAEEEYDYQNLYCDGLVVQINSNNLFNKAGIEGNYSLGNVALKVGVWEQDLYAGVVQTIIWTRGKNKRTPVAVVSERAGDARIRDDVLGAGRVINPDEIGVLTASGNRVRNVPVYEARNILILEAYPGNVLHFRYGGEAGVVPCFSDGTLLTEEISRGWLEGLQRDEL